MTPGEAAANIRAAIAANEEELFAAAGVKAVGVKPSEYAEDIVRCLLRREDLSDRTQRYLRGRIALAVAQAVAEERERCVTVLLRYNCDHPANVERMVREMRQVGESEGAVGRSQGP